MMSHFYSNGGNCFYLEMISSDFFNFEEYVNTG